MKNIKNDLLKLPQLLLGFAFMSLGIWMLKESGLGMPPWDCLTQGTMKYIPLSFGQLSQITGLIILGFAMLLKVYPGIGTILNIIFIGVFYDVIDSYLSIESSTFLVNVAIVIIGSFSMATGTVLYMKAGLGQGPRDSVILGIYKLYTIKYGFIKFGIEAVVLVIGIILGGTAGVGTALALFFISFFTQEILNKIKLDPKQIEHKYLHNYFK